MADNITILDSVGASKIVRTRELAGGVHVQVMAPHSASGQELFTTVVNGTAVDSSIIPVKQFTLQIGANGGTPTVWTVILKGSLNNVNFDEIGRHSSADGDAIGDIKIMTAIGLMKYFRLDCTVLTLSGATNLQADVTGEAM